MNILFYKLLAYKELKKEVDYILQSRDLDYSLENFILRSGYNPLKKIKELEEDLDSQICTPEIIEHINTRNDHKYLGARVMYFNELDVLIKERFKFCEVFILKRIYEYLCSKGK